MKPYLMTLAAFVCISFLLLVPEVYAQFSGPAGAGVRQIASAVDSARNRLAALEDIETASRALYKVLQPEQTTMADVRSAEYLTPLLRR